MSDADIRIDISRVKSADFAEAIGRQIAGEPTWSRDGILEHQVSTQEELQYCFRNEPGSGRPRTAICLAGSPETLTVATVVPIDRDVELSDQQYAGVVREFHDDVLAPALASVDVSLEKQL